MFIKIETVLFENVDISKTSYTDIHVTVDPQIADLCFVIYYVTLPYIDTVLKVLKNFDMADVAHIPSAISWILTDVEYEVNQALPEGSEHIAISSLSK